MATRHDNRNRRPVRNALLKWQLQQDQRRIVEVQRRLMRMAAPSPSSSLGVDSSSFDRRPTAVCRPRPVHHHDPDEDALMTLIMEREEREAATSNQPIDRLLKPSKLQYPTVLPPLRRSENHPKPPLNNSVRNVSLRSTGQKLNAAGEFYSPVRPRELNSSSSEFRQNLAFSRIKAPAPKRLVGATAAPSPRNPLRYEQMKTPDRWRTTAMRSNQEEVDESALRRWEEEDALQADRLLEKAAREGDNEALWNDLFYGTKAARAKTNQLQPEQPIVYSTSSFPEMFSRTRSNSQSSSCYEAGADRPESPMKTTIGDDGMLPSDLSTMSTTKPSTTQHSAVGSPVTDSNGASAPTSTQSISEMLASMEKVTKVEPVAGDLAAGGDQNYSGGGDREQFSRGKFSTGDPHFAQHGVSSGVEFPRWSVIVVASCLVIGTSGFFMEELMSLMGLFSKRTPFTLSRVEQERMRNRVSVLQQELQGFQLSTSEIELKSQTVLTELRQHMDRMRLDREKHQDILANEMQELRRHILHITHELVEQERESIQTQLEEMVKVHVINQEGADDRSAIAGTDIDNEKELEETTSQAPIQVESYVAMHDPAHDAISTSSSADTKLGREIDDEQLQNEQTKAGQSQEQVVVSDQPKDEVAVSAVQTSRHLGNAQAHAGQKIGEKEHAPIVVPSKMLADELINVQDSQIEPERQVFVQDIKVEHVQEVVSASVPALEQSGNKIDVAVAPASKVVAIVKPSNTSGMSWDGILLLVGIMFLAACVVLRVYNINRRKRWFEERRKRRNQRALLSAQRRARAMAENQGDSDEWDGDETDGGVEEVSLMTPVRDCEDDEARPELQRQSPDIDTDFDDYSRIEQTSHLPAETHRLATTEVSSA